MSKFNRGTVNATATAPIQTKAQATGRTYNGAPGFERNPQGELFLLAVANMVSENTFYEAAGDRDNRFAALVQRVAVEDPDWFQRFVGWLRGPEANMRSASLVAAAEGVKALLDAGSPVSKRSMISSVLQRADEPGEMIAYWIAQYGRNIPKPVKRGISDAIQRLYNEYGTLKYDTQSATVRFADVLALTHAEPVASWQADLFDFIKARRWNRLDTFEIPETLAMVRARQIADGLTRDALIEMQNSFLISEAGYTWENVAGKGAMDAQAWEAVIPNMGVMALLRNLRNFDQAGIGQEAQNFVRSKLTDPETIAKSRLFPFRFLSAYQALGSDNYSRELEVALNLSLANVPVLKGRTLVLVDRSGSMFSPVGGSLSTMSRADAAALFGTTLALRAEKADLVQFGSNWSTVSVKPGDSVLKAIKKFGNLGGTDTQAALAASFAGQDRVVIVTDEQASPYWGGGEVGANVPDSTPILTWNLAGYKHGHNTSGGVDRKARYTMGGLSDAAFKVIPLLEAGKNGNWPF